jgi:hypothetical protein
LLNKVSKASRTNALFFSSLDELMMTLVLRN